MPTPSPPPTAQSPSPPAAPPKQTPRDKKLQSLLSSNARLEEELEALQAAQTQGIARLKNPEKKGVDTVKRHIELLHEYNEVKDVAMGLMGLVADNRGATVGEVLREHGVGEREQGSC